MAKIRIYNFRKLSNKVLSHAKKMTMRLPRKRESQPNEIMHPYVVFRPGEATIKKLVRKQIKDITLEEAQTDGFKSIHECQKLLMEMHSCKSTQEVDLTYFDPHWRPLKIVSLYDLDFIIKRLKKFLDETDKGWKPRYDMKIIYDLLIELINTEDPRVDMRSLDVFINE